MSRDRYRVASWYERHVRLLTGAGNAACVVVVIGFFVLPLGWLFPFAFLSVLALVPLALAQATHLRALHRLGGGDVAGLPERH